MNNKKAKERLIELYGPECFIDKLHLRQKSEQRHYTSKSQCKRMKQLTFHHIREKSKGGKATVENGALLSQENHIWFNKQSPAVQAKINEMFQEYKECGIVFVDELETKFKIQSMLLVPERDLKYNRAKEKERMMEIVKEYEDEELDR